MWHRVHAERLCFGEPEIAKPAEITPNFRGKTPRTVGFLLWPPAPRHTQNGREMKGKLLSFTADIDVLRAIAVLVRLVTLPATLAVGYLLINLVSFSDLAQSTAYATVSTSNVHFG